MLSGNSQPFLSRLVLILLSVFGGTVIVYSLIQNYDKLLDFELSFGLVEVSISSILMVGMLYSKAVVHVQLIDPGILNDQGRFKVIHSYSLSQVVRYLPGKLLGILAQSFHLTGNISTSKIWAVNLLQYIVTNIYSIAVILVVFTSYLYGIGFGIVLACIGGVFVYVAFRSDVIHLAVSYMLECLKKTHLYGESLSLDRPFNLTVLLGVEWLFYFSSWFFIVPDSFELHEVVIFSTLYAAASFIATLAVVMPSGIVVREAAFIWLGSLMGFGSDLLFVYSVISRVLFTMSDLLFFFIISSCRLYWGGSDDS